MEMIPMKIALSTLTQDKNQVEKQADVFPKWVQKLLSKFCSYTPEPPQNYKMVQMTCVQLIALWLHYSAVSSLGSGCTTSLTRVCALSQQRYG